MRHRFILVLLSLVFINLAVAQNRLNPSYSGDEFIFVGERQIRFIADYADQSIWLPDAQLWSFGVLFPADFRVIQYPDGILINVGGSFRVTLSADEKRLTIVRHEELGTVPDSHSDDERAPIIYRLANADPSKAAALLRSMYSSLRVDVDERQRALLVMMNPGDRSLIDQVIQQLDQAMPQVIFEAEILEVNQSLTQSLGINYDSLFTFSLAEDKPAGIFALGPISRNSPISLTLGINLLKTSGAAEVLARPRVTTLDGVQAQLNATQTFPVVVSSSDGKESVQNITTGIQLNLLPRISPDGVIEAELSISVSTPTGITSQKVPTFSSREARTTVRVRNGEPIVIGGLYEKRRLEGTQKVPLLGDIPLIGALFTSTSVEERETDLVIVVTPRIVEDGSLLTVPAEP